MSNDHLVLVADGPYADEFFEAHGEFPYVHPALGDSWPYVIWFDDDDFYVCIYEIAFDEERDDIYYTAKEYALWNRSTSPSSTPNKASST